MSTLKFIIIFLLLSILSTGVVSSQDSEEYIVSLFQKLNVLDEEGDYKNIVYTLMELYRIDPVNKSTKRFFEVILNKYETLIFSDEELLDELLYKINNVSFIPVEQFIAFYYNSNDQPRLKKILNNVTSLDTSYLRIDGSFFSKLDPTINNKSYTMIEQILKHYSTNLSTNVDIQINLDDVVVKLSQEERKNIQTIFATLTILEARSDYIGLIDTLVAILKIDPHNRTAKSILGNVILKFQKEIFADKDLLIKFLPYIDDYTKMPAQQLLLYFYNSNDFQNVNKLLTQITSSPIQNFSIDSDHLLLFDRRINPELYNKIMNKLFVYVNLSSPAMNMILYYQADLQSLLKRLLDDNSLHLNQNDIKLNELLLVDPEINEENFKLLFVRLLDIIPSTDIDTLQQTKILYQFAKQNYLSGIEIQVKTSFDKISSNIVSGVQRFDELLIWSISSLYKNQNYRANLFLDQIYAYGNEKDLEYLEQELTWWRDHGFAIQFIDPILEKYFSIPSPTTSLVVQDDNLINESWFGEYYALIIGIEEYIDENVFDLNYPVSDANSLVEVLTKYYSFKNENVTFLKNPTRDNIISKFYELRNTISDSDNLLVFYAGHGVWDADIDQGYWLPRDAEYDEITNWLSNSEIRDLLKGIKAKHTLLIADACFSGSIFLTREPFLTPDKSVQETFKRVSRQAITSGALNTVPDKSVFLEYLIKYLTKNGDHYLPAQKLYLEFKDAVANNSPNKQSPRFGVIYNAGDEGGDFIFIKK